MDFKTVLKLVIKNFKKENVRYALIGGFALGCLGISRTTVDLDFLVDKDDLPKIDKIMKDLGYKCRYKSENVSQYISPLKIFGEIDFLHAFRKISLRMLENTIEKPIFNGQLKIKILKPEDLIGLKIQAIVNDKERRNREFIDIEELMILYKGNLDWQLLEEYFSLFELKDKFKELKKKYGKIN
ncbi:MAG: nucleotidyl transferase AbiEii/AbiGii toxin family protein [Endomicrobiia bacterium]